MKKVFLVVALICTTLTISAQSSDSHLSKVSGREKVELLENKKKVKLETKDSKKNFWLKMQSFLLFGSQKENIPPVIIPQDYGDE